MSLPEFNSPEEEFHFHLIRAELHARQAHDLLYREDGPKRNFVFRLLTGRAQSILMGLYVLEMGRKERG